VIVNDFNPERIALLPNKADTPAVIYPNTVLPRAVASQQLQAVARGQAQIFEAPSVVEHP
jgi:hypothetical protein